MAYKMLTAVISFLFIAWIVDNGPLQEGFLRPFEKPLPPSGLSKGWISVYPHLKHPNPPYYACFFFNLLLLPFFSSHSTSLSVPISLSLSLSQEYSCIKIPTFIYRKAVKFPQKIHQMTNSLRRFASCFVFSYLLILAEKSRNGTCIDASFILTSSLLVPLVAVSPA